MMLTPGMVNNLFLSPLLFPVHTDITKQSQNSLLPLNIINLSGNVPFTQEKPDTILGFLSLSYKHLPPAVLVGVLSKIVLGVI